MNTSGIQCAHDTKARQRGVGDERQARPRAVVDDGKHPEATAVGEGVGHEVEAPAGVGAIGNEYGLAPTTLNQNVNEPAAV